MDVGIRVEVLINFDIQVSKYSCEACSSNLEIEETIEYFLKLDEPFSLRYVKPWCKLTFVMDGTFENWHKGQCKENILTFFTRLLWLPQQQIKINFVLRLKPYIFYTLQNQVLALLVSFYIRTKLIWGLNNKIFWVLIPLIKIINDLV